MLLSDPDKTPDNCPGDAGAAAAEKKGELRHRAAGDERTEECKSDQVTPKFRFWECGL